MKKKLLEDMLEYFFKHEQNSERNFADLSKELYNLREEHDRLKRLGVLAYDLMQEKGFTKEGE